jgi:single-strand DNA-binding protein
MARSLNKAVLIGNLTRDPELRYTPQGSAVCTFGLATNRQWKTDSGEKKEDVEFHRIVAWNKLAEICAQLLKKGRKVYLEGRLQTRNWDAQDGTQRTTTEVVISEMILLDSRREEGDAYDIPDSAMGDIDMQEALKDEVEIVKNKKEPAKKASVPAKEEKKGEEASEDDIPF